MDETQMQSPVCSELHYEMPTGNELHNAKQPIHQLAFDD